MLPSPEGTCHTALPGVYELARERQGPGLWGPRVPFMQEPPTLDRACHSKPPTDTQHTAPGKPVRGKGCCSHKPLVAQQVPRLPPYGPHTRPPRRGSPELPAQFLEEKPNGEEAQGGWSGEDASAVILQVLPQATGEGLSGKEAGRRAAGHRDTAAELRT